MRFFHSAPFLADWFLGVVCVCVCVCVCVTVIEVAIPRACSEETWRGMSPMSLFLFPKPFQGSHITTHTGHIQTQLKYHSTHTHTPRLTHDIHTIHTHITHNMTVGRGDTDWLFLPSKTCYGQEQPPGGF